MVKAGVKRSLPRLVLDKRVDAPPASLSSFQAKVQAAAGPIKVLPGLYLGNERHASDRDQLDELGIGAVLNVAVEVAGWPELSASHLSLGWTHNQRNIVCCFDQAFAFIDSGRASSVLVHCQEGVSRSASLVIAYLMKTFGLSATRAYAFLKSRSPAISPNIHLFSQLVRYETELASPKRPFCFALVASKRPRSASLFVNLK